LSCHSYFYADAKWIEWEHIDDHTAFQKSEGYQFLLERLEVILDSAPRITHVKLGLDEKDKNPLDAPVTECVCAYFPSSQDGDAYVRENWLKFQAELAKMPGVEVQGMAGGWSTEPQTHDGTEGKMFAAFVGWESVDAHLEFRKTEGFGRIIGLLRGGARGVEVHHTAFTRHT